MLLSYSSQFMRQLHNHSISSSIVWVVTLKSVWLYRDNPRLTWAHQVMVIEVQYGFLLLTQITCNDALILQTFSQRIVQWSFESKERRSNEILDALKNGYWLPRFFFPCRPLDLARAGNVSPRCSDGERPSLNSLSKNNDLIHNRLKV